MFFDGAKQFPFPRTKPRNAALPVVISTAAQRSGETSVLTPPLGNVFRRSEAVSLSPHQAPKRCPPRCHLDRSAAERRDLCVDASPWKCFSTERSSFPFPAPSPETLPSPLSSRPQRSGAERPLC